MQNNCIALAILFRGVVTKIHDNFYKEDKPEIHGKFYLQCSFKN